METGEGDKKLKKKRKVGGSGARPIDVAVDANPEESSVPRRNPQFQYEISRFFPVDGANSVVFAADAHRIVQNDDVFTDDVSASFYQSWSEGARKCGCVPELCTGFCCRSSTCYLHCGCFCRKDKIEYLTLPSAKKVEETGGFDIKESCVLSPVPPVSQLSELDLDYVNKLAVLAIKRYNIMHKTGYMSVSFIKGNAARVHGVLLSYITFIATIPDGDRDLFDVFQAKLLDTCEATISCPRGMADRRVVLLCRKIHRLLRGLGKHAIVDHDVVPNQFFKSIISKEMSTRRSHSINQHQFYDNINYDEPVIFLRDVLMGILDKVRNDDVLADSPFFSASMLCQCKEDSPPCTLLSGCNGSCRCDCTSQLEDAFSDLTKLEKDYVMQVDASQGFDIDVEYNGPLRTIVPRPLDEKNVEDLDYMWKVAVLAIKRYNIAKVEESYSPSASLDSCSPPRMDQLTSHDNNGYYRCKSFIKANVVSVGDDSLYYITFTASAPNSVVDIVPFQAKVLDSPRGNGGRVREVFLCRPHPCPRRALQDAKIPFSISDQI